MKLASTPRVEFLRALAGEILHNYGRGRTVISVDGTDASGRADFADDLAEVLEETGRHVNRASMRYFHVARAEQDADISDAEVRLYRSGLDDSALRRVLIEPFRLGGSTAFVTQQRDPDSDTWIEPTWQTAPDDALLILDGAYLNRPEVHNLWLYSILLENAADAAADAPDGAAHRLYIAEVAPRDGVNAVIDTTDVAAPERRFLDRC